MADTAEPDWKRIAGRIAVLLRRANGPGDDPESAAKLLGYAAAYLAARQPMPDALADYIARAFEGAATATNAADGVSIELRWIDALLRGLRLKRSKLRTGPALAARALEFAILTAARTSEAIGATWSEVDLDAALWVVPANRMKAGQEHRVPLSSTAIALLKALKPKDSGADTLIFTADGKALSNMAMTMVLRRLDRADVTVHGVRSTFRDWAGDVAGFPRELAE